MPKLKIIGFMPVYNEADILEQSITHMAQQGIPLIIIDNNSTDGSLDIERRLIGKGVLEVIVKPSQYFSLKALYDEMLSRLPAYFPDWIIHHSADEFLESPIPNKTLAEAIEEVDGLGYNLIQFNCFNFVLTEKDYSSHELDVRKRLRYYTWSSDCHYLAWKYDPGIDFSMTGASHEPPFPPDIKEHVFPAKFIIRHYMFRSLEHGMRKVFTERLPRYAPEERAIGWHVHYNNMKPDPSSFIVDSLKCNKYDEDGRWILEKKFDTYFGAWNTTNTEHISKDDLSKKMDAISKDLQRQLDAIYRSPPVRLYLALKGLLKRIV